jgi:Rieske Fe-S protein
MNTEHPSIPRRNFLSRILAAWTAFVILPALYVVIEYVIPPKLREKLIESLKIGKLADIVTNDVKMVKFNKTPVMIVRNDAGQIKAFSAVCTHLGCIVEFRSADRKFHCNCHGSVFDYDGKNVGGPAPRPLQSFRVEIRQDDIYVSNS